MRITFVLGTRPEVIKLAPVILEARKRHRVKVVFTGQHAHMALPLARFFGITPDLTLDVMVADQTLTGLSGALLKSLDQHAADLDTDFLVTQGDTTSAFVASYWGFCRKLRVVHVEAGLRTNDISSPFPEEANRQLIGRIAELHFAPTNKAARALAAEKVPAKIVFTVGNTAIDALFFARERLEKAGHGGSASAEILDGKIRSWVAKRRLVLVTAHRRENFGEPLREICKGIKKLVDSDPRLCAVYPVHPNPNVKNVVEKLLGGHERILLTPPQGYLAFVELMSLSSLILTDSGGVQEEAPSLKKPILVLRESSERPEGVKRGFARLVGSDPEKICRLGALYLKKGCGGKGKNPYGDGSAAKRIVKILERSL